MRTFLFSLLSFACLPLMAQAQLFEPGNIIFSDPDYTPDGQIVELAYDRETGFAEIVNVVRWEVPEGAERRRALGLDVDANGNVWVGITIMGADTPTPTGTGEALRIERDGTQTFFATDTNKVTHLAAIGANQVIVNSNHADFAHLAQLIDATGDEPVLTDFNKTGHGEALMLPDGRILMGDNGAPGIHIYERSGGDPVGMFYDDGRTVRSLTYNDEIGAVVALLQDQSTLLRISLDGTLEQEWDAANDNFYQCWGVAQVPGTTNVFLGNHLVPDTFNEIALYDATDFSEYPQIIAITSGFEVAGREPGFQFRSFFNIALVPEITGIEDWSIF